MEAQNDYYVDYDIITRAIFYCARMISSQYGTEFCNSNYKNICKVYSIWLCTDEGYYDLMEAVIICLGKEDNKSKGTKLHQLISTLLSTVIKTEDKKRVLKQEFDIETSVELEEGMRNMCNLADGIEARAIARGIAEGRAEGRAETLVALVRDGLLSKEEAAKRAEMSIEEFEKIC